MNSAPSYITKNRLGIFYFQYVIPSIIYHPINIQKKKVFRKSLRTRDRRQALRMARIMWLIMEKLTNKYFKDPTQLGRALKLLQGYDDIVDCDWETAQRVFFDKLDDEIDVPLLNLALSMRQESLENDTQNSEEIARLKNTIDYLLAQNANNLPTHFNSSEDPKLTFLIEKWLRIKENSGLKVSTLTSINQRIHVFLKIMNELKNNDPIISELSSEDIRKFCEILKKLPSERTSKIYRDEPLLNLIELNLEPISNESYKEYINQVVSFLKWVSGDDYPINKAIIGILNNSKTKNSTSIDVLPFNDDDLKKIFTHDSYINGLIKRASDYWVPLIALYTGARLGEICQLHVSDIRIVENVWVIDINEDSDTKSIKTEEGSKRLVPIKQELISLGLIEYWKFISDSDNILLFPDEKRNSNAKFDAISKRFNNSLNRIGLRKNLNIKQRKSFHSLRHTVRTRLVDLGVDDGLIDSIVGHTSYNRSIGERVYTHTQRIKTKVTALSKLKYQFEFSLIKKWDECQFAKILKRDNLKNKQL